MANWTPNATEESSSATIKVGDVFLMTDPNVHKGFSKKDNAPYLFAVRKAGRGFASVKLFVKNPIDCMNAQSFKVTKIWDASSAPKKTPEGRFYNEFKISAYCEAEDAFKEERAKTSEEFEHLVMSDTAEPEKGLFDQYSDGSELPFA